MAESTEKIIRYRIVIDPPDANQVKAAQAKVNAATKQEAARTGAATIPIGTPSPFTQTRRTRRPASDPTANVAGATQTTLNRLGNVFTQRSGGIGTIFGQTLRGIGLTGPQAAFGRVLAGGAMRGAIGGLGAAGGAGALAGAGPAGLVAGAVLLSLENLRGAMNHAVASVSQFGKAFLTGDASQALHGVVSYMQSFAQALGGPIIGGIFARFVGVGHTFISSMDSLVNNLGRWNPLVMQQQSKYAVMQQLFSMKVASVLEPVLSAWVSIKIKLLDGLAKVVDVAGHVAKYFWSIVEASMAVTKFFLKVTGVTYLWNKFLQGLNLVVEGMKMASLAMLNMGKSLLDWVAQFDPTGAAAELSKGITELIDAVSGSGKTLSDAANNAAKNFFGLNARGLVQPGNVPPRNESRIQGVPSLNVGTDAFKGQKTIKPTTQPTAAGGVATASFSMTVTGAGAIVKTVNAAVGNLIKPTFAGMAGASIVPSSAKRPRWGAGSGGSALNLVEGFTFPQKQRNPWIREEAQWQADHSIRFWDPMTHQHRDPNAGKASAAGSITVTHAGSNARPTTEPAALTPWHVPAPTPIVHSGRDAQIEKMIDRLRQKTDKPCHRDESGMFDTLANLMRGNAIARGM